MRSTVIARYVYLVTGSVITFRSAALWLLMLATKIGGPDLHEKVICVALIYMDNKQGMSSKIEDSEEVVPQLRNMQDI